ncbi:MAG: MFS transporter [Roseiarcus sp.]
MGADPIVPGKSGDRAPSRWGAFGHPAFAIIWIGSTIALIGIAMSDTASGWLMTSLNPDPMAVSMVQVASNLPMFLFTLPAGALADIIEPRRLLIALEIGIALLVAGFAMVVSLGLATPASLLTTTLALSAAWSLTAPAWLSLTPLLVPRGEMDGATAANSIGYNLSRALGPALGGLAIAGFGVAAPYWLFAGCNLAAIAALLAWRAPRRNADSLPAERLASAIRTGLRHAANNGDLRATLARTVAIYPFASAYWALLPLVVRSQVTAGPEFYGVLLGAISVGAIVGSFALNWLEARLGPDRAVAMATLVAAFALVLFGLAREPAVAIFACVVAGAAWIVILAILYVSAQVALPDWVRARGLAIFLTVIFGAMTAGSAAWGEIAGAANLPTAYFVAAGGAVLAIPLTWRWKLQTGARSDLTPSLHWRAPAIAGGVEDDQGPILVTVDYRVAPENRAAFVLAVDEIGRERRRDGAFGWGAFEDAADKGRFLETFQIESWLEMKHLRERVTKTDRLLEDRVHAWLESAPTVTFFVASGRRSHGWKWRVRHPGA